MVTARELIVFDMDGVLVEVTESYRETIRQTVRHFTGADVSYAEIQDYKNAGGWNNDWALSQRLARDHGAEVEYGAVVAHFQKLFLGEAGDGGGGLIARERWVARDGLFTRLGARYDFAVYTGRPREEAWITLRRNAGDVRFHPVVTTDDVREGKPAPEGLHQVAAAMPGRRMWYVGDTVDDARCARAAGVAFIGIVSPANTRYLDLVELFCKEKAAAIYDDINYMEEFFANRVG